jgi:carboxymethylenebutenolidase
VALLVAAKRTLGAAVSVGGEGVAAAPSSGMPSLVDAAPGLTCPWLGLYGESPVGGEDCGVAQLRDAAAASQVATNVVVYPRRGHRFDDDPDIAADAWLRTLNWFDAHLR